METLDGRSSARTASLKLVTYAFVAAYSRQGKEGSDRTDVEDRTTSRLFDHRQNSESEVRQRVDVNLQHRVNPFTFAVEEWSVITNPGLLIKKSRARLL